MPKMYVTAKEAAVYYGEGVPSPKWRFIVKLPEVSIENRLCAPRDKPRRPSAAEWLADDRNDGGLASAGALRRIV